MIKLEIEAYCQDCLDFKPDVIKPDPRYMYLEGISREPDNDTIIRCEHRKRCRAITRYLACQMKGEQK